MILPACEFFLKSESSFFTRFSTSRHSYGSLLLLGEPFSLLLRVFSGFPAVRNTSFRFFASDIRHFVRLPFRYFLLCPSFVRQFLSERSERRPLGNLTRLASLLSRRRSISGLLRRPIRLFFSESSTHRFFACAAHPHTVQTVCANRCRSFSFDSLDRRDEISPSFTVT